MSGFSQLLFLSPLCHLWGLEMINIQFAQDSHLQKYQNISKALCLCFFLQSQVSSRLEARRFDLGWCFPSPHRSGSKESRMPHREGFHTRGVGVIFGGCTSIVQTFRSQRETDLRFGPESKWSVLLDTSVYLVWWVITSPWSIIAKVLRCKVILSETKFIRSVFFGFLALKNYSSECRSRLAQVGNATRIDVG